MLGLNLALQPLGLPLGTIGGGGSGSPAFSVVGYATDTSNSRVSDPISFASNAVAGAQAGDIAIAVISDDLSTDYGNSTGWTEVYSDTAFDGSSFAGLYYKVLTDSDVSFAPTPGGYSSGVSTTAILAVLRGVSWVGHTTTLTDTKTLPAATSSNPGVFLAITHIQDDAVTSVLPPTGYTELASLPYSAGSPKSWTHISYKETTDTTEGPITINGDMSASNYMRVTGVNLSK